MVFKVFKLDSSNLKQWQPDYDDPETTLFDSINNYVEGRSELDAVFKGNDFADDSAKGNIKEILKTAGLEEDALTTV